MPRTGPSPTSSRTWAAAPRSAATRWSRPPEPARNAPANQEVWDRWNALAPADQASAFVETQERLVATFEGLTPEQRESIEIDLGFMPQPVPLATVLGMRLNEAALHGWDVEVGLDPAAGLSDDVRRLLAEHFTETMSFLLGFVGKPEGGSGARVAIGDYSIVVGHDGVRLGAGTDGATATFEGPLEAGSGCWPAGSGPSTRPPASR